MTDEQKIAEIEVLVNAVFQDGYEYGSDGNLPGPKTDHRMALIEAIESALRAAVPEVPEGWTEHQIADAAMAAEIPDSKLESLLIALEASPKQAPQAAQPKKPLFAEMVSQHPGLREELLEMDAQPAGAVLKPEPVSQYRKICCADWYDGHPDLEDGGGPYEVRTLYTHPHQSEQVRKPLSDAEIADLWDSTLFHITDLSTATDFVRDVEAAHNIREN
jgi:hypothetical protein